MMTTFSSRKHLWVGFAVLLVLGMMLCTAALADTYPESAHPYANNSDLTWVYSHSAAAHSLKVTFSSDTELEDGKDYLYITGSDGAERSFTGSMLKGATVTIPGNGFTMRLSSDAANTAYGFRITGISAVAYSSRVESGVCGSVFYELDLANKVLTLYGNGYIPSFSTASAAPWYGWRYNIEKVVIEEGITSIGSHNFSDLTALKEVVFPSTLSGISTYGFENYPSTVNASGVSGDCSWRLQGADFTVSGTGAMADYTGGLSAPWCWLKSRITSITIQEGVTHAGSYAFYDTGSSYCSLFLPDTLVSIGKGAFESILLKTLTLPDSLKEIGDYAFQQSAFYLSSITLPDGLETLGASAFSAGSYSRNTSLKSVRIPASVQNWGSGAFAAHAALTSVTLESGLTKIGPAAFRECTGLASITFPDSIIEIGSRAFYGCSSLVYTLPRYVEVIGSEAFYVSSCRTMTSVTLPATIKSTGFNAFPTSCYDSATGEYIDFQIYHSGGVSGNYTWGISNGILKLTGSGPMENYDQASYPAPWRGLSDSITALSLDSRMTTIGNAAFAGLTLGDVSLPSGITSIGEDAFYGTRMNAFSAPAALRTIGNEAFYTSSVQSISLQEGLTTIGDQAFWINANGNLSTLAIPESVTTIGYNIVNPSFTTVTSGLWKMGNLGTNITWQLKGETLYLSGTGDMPSFDHETSSKYNIDQVDTPWWSFKLRFDTVVIGEGITSVSNAAFYKCSNLTTVSLPSTLTAIKAEAFEKTGLTSIDIPDSVTTIGLYAFWNTQLTSFTHPRGVSEMVSLNGCTKLETVIFPKDANITSMAGSTFGGCTSLKSIELPDTITEIAPYAFSSCTSLESVKIPSGVTEIGSHAFYKCSALAELQLPNALTFIDQYAFAGCTALAQLSIPDSVSTIGDYCFDGCTGLTAVSLPASLTNIAPYSFRKCTSLSTVTIPSGVTTIGGYAFYQCTGLTEAVLNEGLTLVDSYAFYGCSALNKLNLPSTLATINGCAFCQCTALTEIRIPASVKAINGNGFGSCTALESIVFEGEAPTTLASNCFTGAKATVTYTPYASWTSKINNYGGTLTWVKVNGSCGAESTWQLETNTILRLNGSGAVTEAGWTEHCDDVTTLVVGAEVSGIDLILSDTLPNLQQIIFSGPAPVIAQNAFEGLTVQAYCLHGEPSWVEDVKLSYGGTASWSVCCSRSGETVTIASAALQETIPATCTTDGSAAYWLCSCGMMFDDEALLLSTTSEEKLLPAFGHSYGEPEYRWAEDGSSCVVSFVCQTCEDEQLPEPDVTSIIIQDPDCLTPGKTEYTAFVLFGDEELPDPENPGSTILQPKEYMNQLVLDDIPALGHTEVTIAGIEPTCTEPGLSDYIFCEVCGADIAPAEEIAPTGHTETVTLEELLPTCTQEGHTKEISCSVCGEVLTASETVAALGHTEYVSAEAIAPDCTEVGWTEEISCSVCDDVVTPAEEIPSLGHTPETDAAVAPTCTETGLTEGSHCSACGEVLAAQEVVESLGHTPETDAAVAPTDRETGLTEGSHCAVCGETLVAQETVPAIFDWDGDTVTGYNGAEADVIIPDGATALGNTLFKSNTAITSVRVPDSVTSLGTQTFFGCTALTDVWLPDHLSTIGAQTFYNVTAKIHTAADGATAIALSYRRVPFTTEEGFTLSYRVTSSTSAPTAVWLVAYSGEAVQVVLPEAIANVPLTQIQAKAFASCTAMQSVLIPESVTSIADDAFTGCAETLVIRSSMDAYAKTWAEGKGFAWAHDEHVTEVLPGVEPTCTEPGKTEGLWCPDCGEILTAQETLPAADHSEVTVPAVPATHVTTGLTEGSYCSACGTVLSEQEILPVVEVLNRMILPASLHTIGEEAFSGDTFTCVILADGCSRIEAKAFAHCAQLKFIEIPSSVNFIDDSAFSGCSDELIIIAPEGSVAEGYANDHGIAYVAP